MSLTSLAVEKPACARTSAREPVRRPSASASSETPRPSSATVISTSAPRCSARSSSRPPLGLPRRTRSSGASMPCAIALRSRWIRISGSPSRMARSSSVSAPSTTSSTSLPVSAARSRTARGSGATIDDSGSVRMPIAAPLSPSSRRSPRSSSSETGRRARTARSAPSACSRRRRWRTVSPTRSSSVSIFSAGTRIERRSPASLAPPFSFLGGITGSPGSSGMATAGTGPGAIVAATPVPCRASSATRSATGSPAPSTWWRNSSAARSRGATRSAGRSPPLRAAESTSSIACASVHTSVRPIIPAAPLIVCVSRKSESTPLASALPASSASSVLTMRSRRSRASSRKISRNSGSVVVTRSPTPGRRRGGRRR